jgi:hypothetical protein
VIGTVLLLALAMVLAVFAAAAVVVRLDDFLHRDRKEKQR